MACSNVTLKGLVNDCSTSIGGIKRIFIADRTADVKFTVEEDLVTAISGGTFHQYYVRQNSSSFTSTATIDPANGVQFIETKLNLVFTRIDNIKRIEINALLVSETYVLVEDANGIVHLLGYENPVTATNSGAESGTQRTDGNKYQLELTDVTSGYPLQVKAEVLSTLTVG